MAETVDPLKKSTKPESANCLPNTRDTKRLQLLELSCAILYFSIEDDYERNTYVTNVCIETKSCRSEKKKEQTCGHVTLSASLFLVIFSTAWHPAPKRERVRFPGERWDPRSELPNNQNPNSGLKNRIKPRSAVIIGSSDPLKFPSDSRIRLKYSPNPPICRPIHPPLYNSIETQSTCFLFLLENTTTRKMKTTC